MILKFGKPAKTYGNLKNEDKKKRKEKRPPTQAEHKVSVTILVAKKLRLHMLGCSTAEPGIQEERSEMWNWVVDVQVG